MGALLDKPMTEKETETGQRDGMKYAVSGMQGWRPEMEDTHIACLEVHPDLPNFAIFCVFDGHGGDFTSNYAQKHFLAVLQRQPHFLQYTALPAQSLRDHSIGLELLQSALLTTFLEIDEDMMKSSDRLLQGGKLDKSGATACSVIITPHHILCVNAGDSRAMYRTGGHTLQLSFDHKPNNHDERIRIEAAGGYVSMKRVDGDLAVSRGLGDFHFKSSPDLPPDLQKVTCIPDFVLVERDPERDEFLVLACDGIWDVQNCWQCSDLVQTLFDEGEQDAGLVVEELLDVCLEKQSKDNMTALMVTFAALHIGQGDGVAARREARHERLQVEERRKLEKDMAKQKLKEEADEVRRRLAARAREREEYDSDSD